MTAMGHEWSEHAVRLALAEVDDPSAILVCLQAVQEALGYVPDEAIVLIAESCNASRADVFGVLTYYRDLRRTPPPPVRVRVCMGEACQSVGARALQREIATVADADVEVDEVFCLGNCALGPAAVVNGTLMGRAAPDSVRTAIREARP